MIKLLTSVYFHFSISELNFILAVIKNLLLEISLISVPFLKYCNEVSAGRRVNMSLQQEITCYKIPFFTLLLIESVLPNSSSFLQFFPYLGNLLNYFHAISQEGTKTEAYCTKCYLAP